MRGKSSDDVILKDNVVYSVVKIKDEVGQFEPMVVEHIKDIFGEKAIYFSKKKIKTLANRNSIPDGFVIDTKNSKWYILELKLLCNDAIRRISRQIVNYKNAIDNLTTRKEIYEAIDEPSNELYHTIYNTNPEIVIIINSLNGDMGRQFEEQVKGTDPNIDIVEFKTFSRDFVEPEKVHLHLFKPLVSENKIKTIQKKKSELTVPEVKNHLSKLEKSNDMIKNIYKEVKEKMLDFDKDLVFNPQNHYISIRKRKNFAYIIILKSKLKIVVMQPLKIGKKIINNHELKENSQSVKNFYGNDCFKVIIKKEKNLDEVIELLKRAYEFGK